MRFPIPVLLALPLAWILGCEEPDKDFRAWQQEQVDHLHKQASQNAATARALVEADARSREELVHLQRDLNSDQQMLTADRNALEQQRQVLETTRQRVPLLANALEGVGALLLGIAALSICGFLLFRVSRDDSSAELTDSLVLELAGESQLLREASTPAITSTRTAALTLGRLESDSSST